MRGQFLIVMDDCGALHTYCRDGKMRKLTEISNTIWHDSPIGQPNDAHRFDGSECFTAECLPEWGRDAYYVENLPISLAECVGK